MSTNAPDLAKSLHRSFTERERDLLADFYNDIQRLQDLLDQMKEKWGDLVDAERRD